MTRYIALLLIATAAQAEKRDEDYYNKRWCAERGGQAEVRIDHGRVDCIWNGYAIEADWARALKPDEGIGQAIRYSEATGLRPGLLLITNERAHCERVIRTRAVIEVALVRVGKAWYQIELWTTGDYEC